MMLTFSEKKRYLESFEQAELRCMLLKNNLQICESAQMQEALEKEKAELEQKMLNIVNAIQALPDEKERNVLTLRYIGVNRGGIRIRYKYLWQIGIEMNYSSEWVKRKHKDAVKNLRIEC